MVKFVLIAAFSTIILGACGSLRPLEPSEDPSAMARQPLTPEESEELLREAGDNWLYGHGMGATALNIGTVVAFPPYALYLLGKGAMSLAGYEPLEFSDALPDEAEETWNEAYDSVVSVPGRAAAFAAGRDFIDRETAKERLEKYLQPREVPREQPRENGGSRSDEYTTDQTYRARYSSRP